MEFIAFRCFIKISPQIALKLLHLTINLNLMGADRRKTLIGLLAKQAWSKFLILIFYVLTLILNMCVEFVNFSYYSRNVIISKTLVCRFNPVPILKTIITH
jgi:hypothetical protein